jgi:hypothetical protein
MYIYLTSSFRPAASVNVVVYLHGHWRSSVHNFDELVKHETIARMLVAVEGTGAPMALAIPALGARSGDDWVSGKEAFASLLKDVRQLAAWRANELKVQKCLKDWTVDPVTGRQVQPLLLGTLILAAHSGGGYTLNRIRTNGGAEFSDVKEIWMFDSLYGGSGAPSEWLKTAERKVIYAFYQDTWRTGELEKLRKKHKSIPNLKPIQKTPNHDHAPDAHIAKLIRDSAYL